MPYKLVYFPVRGRAQAFLYMTTDNGIDVSIETCTKDTWPAMKPKVVFGQLPVLYDGDFEIAQSNAIIRHVARKHGLYGSNDKEQTQIDMINDQQEDIRLAYLKLIYMDYDTPNAKQDFLAGLPGRLAPLEKVLGRNKDGKEFFVGNKVSFVDYTMFDLLDNLITLSSNVLDQYPLLKGFHTRMAAREKLAKLRATEQFKNTPINGNGKQ